MSRPLHRIALAHDHCGPLLIGMGLAIVLTAQIWSVVPLAAAISLIGFGATLTLVSRHQHEFTLVLNLTVYLSITGLAVLAQLNSRSNLMTTVDVSLAMIVSVANVVSMRRWRMDW